MQSKQIKADGQTVYAYAKDWDWKTSSRYGGTRTRSAQPVVVTATGVGRKYWGGYGYTHAKDGVAVTYLDPKTMKPTDTKAVVRPAEIRQLWEEFAVEAAEAAKIRRERERQDLQIKQDITARLNAIFGAIPEAKRPWFTEADEDGIVTQTKGTIYNYELAALLEAAYLAGERMGGTS